MSIMQRLTSDHAFFRDYLNRCEEAAHRLPEGAGFPFIDEWKKEFSPRYRRHARIENEILFPALQKAVPAELRSKTVGSFLHHGDDEHASVARREATFIAATENKKPEDDWRKQLAQFVGGLLGHLKFEEDEIFPLIQQVLTEDQLEQLGQKIETIP